MPIRPELRNRPLTEAEYYEVVNELLHSCDRGLIGSYCLGYSAMLLAKGAPLSVEVLESLAACTSVAEGEAIYARELHAHP